MKSIIILLLVASLTSSFALVTEKVEISCSEQDARIFVDGILVGNGRAKITVRKGECTNIKVTKVGFVTVEKNYCNKRGNSFPERDFIKMEVDEAYTSSVSTQVANVDITLKVSSPGIESWKALNNVILTYFDVIELTDKETSYLRTAWAIQVFNSTIVRTRFIVKNDVSGYKVKLISEISEPISVNTDVKNDQKYREWDRILRKYENLITDLQSRVK